MSLIAATNFTFTEQLVLNLVGPLLTVLLGTLIIGLGAQELVQRAERRREEAARRAQQRREDAAREAQERREDAMREAERRRADHALRERLIAEVTQAPSALYLATQHYWRAKEEHLSADDLKAFRDALDQQYLESRRVGIQLEHLLKLHFADPAPRQLCHRVMDLLTVRYFQVVSDQGVTSDGLRKANEGDQHSGLSREDLKWPRTVLDKYHETLPDLVDAVANGKLEVSPESRGE
jgi:hypothetical protein